MHWSYVFINLIILLLLGFCSSFTYGFTTLNIMPMLIISWNALIILCIIYTLLFNVLNWTILKHELSRESAFFAILTSLISISYTLIF